MNENENENSATEQSTAILHSAPASQTPATETIRSVTETPATNQDGLAYTPEHPAATPEEPDVDQINTESAVNTSASNPDEVDIQASLVADDDSVEPEKVAG